jgi:hypothetical protein
MGTSDDDAIAAAPAQNARVAGFRRKPTAFDDVETDLPPIQLPEPKRRRQAPAGRLYTEEEMRRIVENDRYATVERLRQVYERRLREQLEIQFNQFTKFNENYLNRLHRSNDRSPSYIS